MRIRWVALAGAMILGAVLTQAETTYTSATVSTTATALTTLTTFTWAFVSVDSGAIRFRVDGTDPTDTEGHYVSAGNTVSIEGGAEIARFRMIRSGNQDAVVQWTMK